MSEKIFADGLWFNEPREGAPDFVLGSISIEVAKFAQFVKDNQKDGKVRVSVLRARESGKPYCVLDTFEPQKKEENPTVANNATTPFDQDDDLPW